MRKLLFISSLLLFVEFRTESKVPELTANVSSIDITPPLEMKYPLGGYGKRMNKPAEGIHDRIWAKALVLRKDGQKYAIITLDLQGIPSNVKPDLIKRISGMGWNLENMMLLPSHSHGSFEMFAINSKNHLNNPYIGIYQPELLEFFLNKLEELIKNVDQNYQPIKIGTSSMPLDHLNRNRRGDPEVDKDLTVTRIDLTNGNPFVVLVNWTAHPTFLDEKDMLVSAEWPGYLQTELQHLIGNGVTAMYYNGAEGDQSPILDGPIEGYKKIEIYGKKLAGLAFELFNKIKPKTTKNFAFSYNMIRLPELVAHPAFMKTGGDEYGLNEELIKIVIDMQFPTEVGLGAIRMGDLIISGVPGEMAAGLGIKVKASIKAGGIKYVAIGGLANEWISYIISKDQYINGAGYESSVSFYGSDFGNLISNEAVKTAIPLTKIK